MSLEAIAQIRQVEEGMEQTKAQARSNVQKAQAEAEKAGQDLLREGREAAGRGAQEAMEKAQARAERRREEILSGAKRDCEALRTAAEAQMGRAVQAIVERVVGS